MTIQFQGICLFENLNLQVVHEAVVILIMTNINEIQFDHGYV